MYPWKGYWAVRGLMRASEKYLGGTVFDLDGDDDGLAGGDFEIGATPADDFFRFFGDSNGDRYVNGEDLTAFRGSYLKRSTDPGYLWHFDYDADGDVRSDTPADDYGQFASRYRTRYLGF